MIIAAPPGYWFLVLQFPENEDEPPKVIERLVVAWEVRDDRQPMQPIVYGDMPDRAYDSALELPDGRCIDDGDAVWPDRAAWLEQSLADYEGSPTGEAPGALPSQP